MAAQQVIRIIDVNLNRASEGLRTLEEVARFIFNDAALTGKIKSLRHALVTGDVEFNKKLLNARQAESDVGADITVPGQDKNELVELVISNSRRVQEALRVLEEIAKLKDNPLKLSTDNFRHARFDLYTLEQELTFRLLRKDKLKFIYGLYPIVDTEALRGRSHAQMTKEIIKAGTTVIQFRDKVSKKSDVLPLAREINKFCSDAGILFIMNDYLDVALATDADGLHIGQEDLPAEEARKILPRDKILGVSCSNLEQAVKAEEDGADYIGHGAIYPTGSKEGARAIGLSRLIKIKKAVSIPVVAIGGISLNNISEVMKAGADSAAVISAILGAPSAGEATRKLLKKIKARKS